MATYNELSPNARRDLANKLEQAFSGAVDMGPDQNSIQAMVDYMGGTRVVAADLHIGQRQVQLWIAAERGGPLIKRLIPKKRLEQLRDLVDSTRGERNAEAFEDGIDVDFAGEVAAMGNDDYTGYRAFQGVIPAAALGDFVAAAGNGAWEKAADAFNAAMMSGGAYNFPGALIMGVDELTLA